jgi:hypothetical protein
VGDQITEEEIGDAYGSYGREYKHIKTTQKTQVYMEDNTEMCLQQRRWKDMDGFHMAQKRVQVVGSCEHHNNPLDIIKGGECLS